MILPSNFMLSYPIYLHVFLEWWNGTVKHINRIVCFQYRFCGLCSVLMGISFGGCCWCSWWWYNEWSKWYYIFCWNPHNSWKCLNYHFTSFPLAGYLGFTLSSPSIHLFSFFWGLSFVLHSMGCNLMEPKWGYKRVIKII